VAHYLGVTVTSYSRPVFRSWTIDPVPGFVIGFKAQDVFNFLIWTEDLDLPLAVSGTIEFENDTQFTHVLQFLSPIQSF
jgi:hypothetical protein